MSQALSSPLRVAPVLMLGALLSVAMTGCGDETPRQVEEGKPRGKVTGKIIFNGEPVTAGFVHFHALEPGPGGSAPLGADGAFTIETAGLEGLPVGTYAVYLTPPRMPHPADPQPAQQQGTFPSVPEKYLSQRTSSLRAEVKEGDNTFDFEVGR